jgi:hypothetical protein
MSVVSGIVSIGEIEKLRQEQKERHYQGDADAELGFQIVPT